MKIRLLLLSLFASASAFADDVKSLSQTVVTATRYETNSFDLPLSIDAVSGSEIRDARTGANLSEIAPRIPGVVINYRSTAAQELSISSRGFGARSQFGVKGMRIYADGIPLSTADGQGQLGAINLDTLGQIEFLRGPFSALYGNSSGGVVQAFTRDGAKDPTITVGASSGTWNTNKQSVTFEGQAGPVNYILNTSQYVSDGYRVNSQYRKDNFNGKISYQFSPDTKLTFVGNYMDQPYTKDPLGLTAAEFAADARQSGKGTNYTVGGANTPRTALTEDTKLYRVNSYAGVTLDHNLSQKDTLRFMFYSGARANMQHLPSYAASEIIRDYEGLDLRWTRKDLFLNKPLTFTIGAAYDQMEDIRTRYGYQNKLVQPYDTNTSDRREKQQAFSFDQYVQASYEPTEKLLMIAGLRRSRVNISNDDLQLRDDVNSTGQVTYNNTSPVAGVTFKITPTLNIYANYGKGFETPTFSETTYSNSSSGTGPNLSMVPSKSKNYELGLKAFVTSNTRINLALFKVDTKNEIVTFDNQNNQATYASTGNSEKKGIEFSLDSRLPYNFNFYQTYTYLDAVFTNSPTVTSALGSRIAIGNRLAGTYKNTAYSELSWKYPSYGFSAAIENIYFGDVNAYDSNTIKAEAYSIVNLRASLKQNFSNWSFSEFVRVDNVFDEKYVANVRVNNTTGQFEPGAPVNYTVGISSSYTFK